MIFVGSLLVFHLFVPVAPFGSWDARTRTDPRGDWHRPRWLHHAAWVWLAAIHFDRALTHWGDAARSLAELDFVLLSAAMAFFEVAFVAATFRVGWRPPTWFALLLFQIAWLAAFGAAREIQDVRHATSFLGRSQLEQIVLALAVKAAVPVKVKGFDPALHWKTAATRAAMARLLAEKLHPSRQAEIGYLQGLLVEASFKIQQEKLSDPVAMRKQVQGAMVGVNLSSDLP